MQGLLRNSRGPVVKCLRNKGIDRKDVHDLVHGGFCQGGERCDEMAFKNKLVVSCLQNAIGFHCSAGHD